jgi:hypothetical protein
MAHAQNIGIGTNTPKERLEVNGAIKIAGSNNINPLPGTIRYNADKSDFEGYNGHAWISLTGGKSQWGDLSSYSYQSDATNDLLGNNSTALGTGLASYGDWLVAGAGIANHAGAYHAGGFRLYKKENGIWKSKQSVFEPAFDVHNEFGMNVAMDANFIVASAAGANANGNGDQGKVYVYTYNSGGSSYSTMLTPTDGYANDLFGSSLAMHNNFIIAGAPNNNILFSEAQGSAYVFHFNGSTWQEMANLTLPGSHPNDRLGQSVAIYGNYAVVASKSAIVNDQGVQGKVCMFQYNGASWSYLTTITSPVNTPNQYFGCSVSLYGDTLVVGASENVNNANGEGKVYVYTRNGNTWNLQATLTPADAHENDGFGTSVHVNKGYLIVGAPAASVNGSRQGKSYIYKSSAQGWSLQSVLTSSNGSIYDGFGDVVHINEHTAFCSAPGATVSSQEDNGRIYFFHRSNP